MLVSNISGTTPPYRRCISLSVHQVFLQYITGVQFNGKSAYLRLHEGNGCQGLTRNEDHHSHSLDIIIIIIIFLMKHSAPFIYDYKVSDMVKYHSDNERSNPLPPLHWLLVLIMLLRFLTCTFRASCYSTRLSWAHTPIIN